jgi:hypothetical protein
VAAYGSGEIFKVELTPEGDTYKAQTSVFARIPHALDVAAAPNGDFFVSCHFTKRIYRIRVKP